MNDLFNIPPPKNQMGDEAFDQYMTPEWAGEELVREFFPDLTPRDMVIEPSCGRGAFIKAIPEYVPCIGVELDPKLAEEARENTSREIITGDFCTVDLHYQPTAFIGNLPFDSKVAARFLDRAHRMLPDNGRCGFIMPAYIIQTPAAVLRWNEHWSLRTTAIPRTLFPRLSVPIIFLTFTKDRLKLLHGFSLFQKASELGKLNKWAKVILVHGQPRKQTWRVLVEEALRRNGGTAELKKLYAAIEGHRPESNKWWKEKVRQICQLYFTNAGPGRWQL